MNCYLCADVGVVPITLKKNGIPYEYYLQCKCGMGADFTVFQNVQKILTEMEISEIIKINKSKFEKKEK